MVRRIESVPVRGVTPWEVEGEEKANGNVTLTC